jgi:hypothetical protein
MEKLKKVVEGRGLEEEEGEGMGTICCTQVSSWGLLRSFTTGWKSCIAIVKKKKQKIWST